MLALRRSFLVSLLLGLGGALAGSSSAQAELKLPALFSDHMVVQRDVKIPVWGWADPQEDVQVALAGASATTKADINGRWRVELGKLAAGGPHTLHVASKGATKVVQDVLVGEVWLGSGQSNMATTVNRALRYEQEQAASKLPQIRMFMVTNGAAAQPQADCEGRWEVCAPETVGRFSATLFFCGRELHQALKVPVGLINSSVGGTPIESWIDADTQRAEPRLKGFFTAVDKAAAEYDEAAAVKNYERQLAKWKDDVAAAKAAKKPLPRKPNDPVETRKRKGNVGGLYNGKIAPLAGYAIRGALWYQGEANSTPEKADYYQYQLPLLIQNWRRRWGQGDFPFAWVQLPNFGGGRPGWLVVREGMLKTLAVPNTGMAVTTDIGESKDIHPHNKQDVGKRLALWARAQVYGENIPYSGPIIKSHAASGDGIVLMFDHAAGLKSGGEKLLGFEIAGADKKWVPAMARVHGETVVVSSAEVKQPAAVRYNWHEEPVGNLTNAVGLPASPFRTEEW